MRRAEMGHAGVARPRRWNACDQGKLELFLFFFFDLADFV